MNVRVGSRQDIQNVDSYATLDIERSPDVANLTADEIASLFGRKSSLVALHWLLASNELQQAALAALLGKAGRRSVRVLNADITIHDYLHLLSRLCSEAAEQSEEDLGYAAPITQETEHWAPAMEWQIPRPTVDPFPPRFADPLTAPDPKLTSAFENAINAFKPPSHGLPDVDHLPIIVVALNPTNTRPFAGQLEDKMFFSGSLLKIAAMYAAFQLRHAVNELGAALDPAKVVDKTAFFSAVGKEFNGVILSASTLVPAGSEGGRAPRYDLIFDATQDAAGKWSVVFRADADPKKDFDGHLKKMIVDSHDPSAGFCIQALGFSWIDGLLQKAGLFDPKTKKGIWLAGDYLLPAAGRGGTRWAHDSFLSDPRHRPSDGNEEFELGISGWREVRVPSENDGPSKQATTCIDAARLLVLLADDKLVAPTVGGSHDDANTKMLNLLADAVVNGASSFVGGLSPDKLDVLQSKIGWAELGPPGGSSGKFVSSEAMIIRQKDSPHLQFVVVWQNVQEGGGVDRAPQIRRILDILSEIIKHYP